MCGEGGLPPHADVSYLEENQCDWCVRVRCGRVESGRVEGGVRKDSLLRAICVVLCSSRSQNEPKLIMFFI